MWTQFKNGYGTFLFLFVFFLMPFCFLLQKVTKGARHKIIISIQKLKERQNLLRSLEKVRAPVKQWFEPFVFKLLRDLCGASHPALSESLSEPAHSGGAVCLRLPLTQRLIQNVESRALSYPPPPFPIQPSEQDNDSQGHAAGGTTQAAKFRRNLFTDTLF